MIRLPLQCGGIMDILELKTASKKCTDADVVVGGTRRRTVKRDLPHVYAIRHEEEARVRGHPGESQIEVMPYSGASATFMLKRGGHILPNTCRNYVYSFRSSLSCKSRGERYDDYCPASLVTFRPLLYWLHNTGVGPEGDFADNVDPVLCNTWRPPGKSSYSKSEVYVATNSQRGGWRAACRLRGGAATRRGAMMATATQATTKAGAMATARTTLTVLTAMAGG